eukprot:CAMPEP_0203823178 /NCGR_PEP_ID=MMETSP0115-20131106/48457_1 /ASSEMBLY_ACC=CAM_ASM_000227 /TAXON_ID=33651 /ORGANISM="Bicosoecid sp, Strain ms1" /LENGTH=265 /DNA_ID=CAMNT_0050732211 /DNA_START=84 /DNA_END=878 /DNA_ORIENTATION=+
MSGGAGGGAGGGGDAPLAQRVGFIGGGMMGSSLAKGLINSGAALKERVLVADATPATLEALAPFVGVVTTDNSELVRASDVVILAVKPQYVAPVLREVGRLLTADHLVVSIAAGVAIETIAALCPEGTRIVRVMPNTPALVGVGAAAFALGRHARKEDAGVVRRIMSAVGIAEKVSESLIDAVTGLSGSGPAYVFLMIEALADGGVRAGLPRGVALKLAAQTVKGAAAMVLETGKHPGVLKDQVCSPGGTTIAGVHALETGGLRA